MAEGSTTSSLTSTSHTLTFVPGMASNGGVHPLALLESLRPTNQHSFLRPPPSIPTASLQVIKDTLEAFAGTISDNQQQRLREVNKKRKRSAAANHDERPDVLKIRKVHIDGFETGQVWQQAKRIISSVLEYSRESVESLQEQQKVNVPSEGPVLEFGEDGFEVDSDDSPSDEEGASEDEGLEDDDDLAEDSASELDDADMEGSLEGSDDLDEAALDHAGEDGDDYDEDDDDEEPATGEYAEDPNGLNDGFFSLDDFNKQTTWFEDQDAKGDPYTDHASDDGEINWDADPFSASAVEKPKKKQTQNKRGRTNAESEDEAADDSEDDGPTFGDMDLHAPEGASDDEDMDMDGDAGDENDEGFNANDIFYKDFFAPPRRKAKPGQPPRKRVQFETTQPDEADINRAMADVRRDLFEDMSDMEDSEDGDLSDASAGDPRSRRSAHERRQAKLAEEIRKLESAAIAKREWTLSGEAVAADRPMNSLLEEDLDFEYAGKPVPVITAEVSEDMEEMIKRRIVAGEFDDVMRRRPDADELNGGQGVRRGLVDLDDTQARKGLAEVYEEEHIKAANPDSYMSKADEKIRKEEQEIERMWKDVSAKLDSLSSWHYKPKPAAPTLSVVADVATVALEDAQPATAQGVAGSSSIMAPQEIYKAGRDRDAGQSGEIVVPRSGLPVARQELTREDKVRRRRREKERMRKTNGGTDTKLNAKARAEKDTVAELRKGGVKVVNKKGEVTDVDGNKMKAAKTVTGSGFKL